MPIVERLMKPGQFTVRLRPSAPRRLTAVVNEFDHVVVTPTRLPTFSPTTTPPMTVLDYAIYTGVVVGQPSGSEITGEGLAFWMGTDEGLGDLILTKISNIAASLSTWMAALLPASLLAGTVNNTGTSTLTAEYQWMTLREATDHACRAMGAEWRVNANFTLDAATPGNLHTGYTTPRAVLTRKPGGSEPGAPAIGAKHGVEATDTNIATDVRGHTTKVIVVGKTGDGAQVATGSAGPGATVYTDINGNPIVMERLVNAPAESAATAAAYAAQVLAMFTSKRSAISLSSRSYAITTKVKVGDRVYVYDLDSGIVDTANTIVWRGELINPMLLRCKSITWGIQKGMGVYSRSSTSGVWYDLTDWVEWETGDTVWEVGTSAADVDQDPSQLGAAFLGVNPEVVARVTGRQSIAWTPVLFSTGTQPTQGAVANTGGFYQIIDGWCHFQGSWQFGAGMNQGTGSYTITQLPIAPKPGRSSFLCGVARVTAGGQIYLPQCFISDPGGVEFRYNAAWPGGADTVMGAGIPVAWAAGGRFEFWGSYPIA